ncbi:MAG TPA: hypothetical protein VFS21_24140 [Roseiflexaceae bacterium]|nr:hypothetical protein [Roseiflexaceae bacterium]
MNTQTFKVAPYQIRHYPDAGSQSALGARHTAALGGLDARLRLISRVVPANLEPVRQPLGRRADHLADLALLLDQLDQLAAGQVRPAEVAALVRQRRHALARALAHHPERARAEEMLDALVAGRCEQAAVGWLRDSAGPLLWPWRWLVNSLRALDTVQAVATPMAIEHFLVVWSARGDLDLLAQTLRHGLLLPAVEPAPLPHLLAGPYRETATALVPEQAGADYLTVLTAYDLPAGHAWGYHNPWSELLADELPLTLAMDVATLPRGRAQGRTADAISVLEAALSNEGASADQRSKDAYRDASYVLERLGQQQLHRVLYAVLVGAPTLRLLDQRAQRIQDRLAGWMRLERVPGAQGQYAKLFSPLPAEAVHAPVVRHLTLTENLARKIPWGQRKPPIAPGVLLGHDLHDNLPLFFDPWGATGDTNAHTAVIGTSGSGKTVLQLHYALQLALSGVQTVMFDPIRKSRLLCEAVGAGAQVYTVDRAASINILDRADSTLAGQLGVVARRLSMVLGQVQLQGEEVSYSPYPLDNLALGALDRALQDRRIYGSDSERLAHLTRTDTPLLGDLVDALRRYAQAAGARQAESAEHLADHLEARALGSMAAILNQPTTLEWHFDHAVIGYDFADVDRLLLPLLYDTGFSALQAWVRNPARRRRWPHLALLLDEFRVMASYDGLTQFVAWATKTWRNFGALCCTGEQNLDTYTRSAWARYILENVRLVLLGRQEASAVEQLGQLYRDRLPPGAQEALRMLAPGEFIALLGDSVHHLSVQLTDLEEAHFLPHRKEQSYGVAA